MAQFDNSALQEQLRYIRTLPIHQLQELLASEIPDERLPLTYLNTLTEDDRTVSHRLILLTWTVTAKEQIPRELQLRASLATYRGFDSIIDAGTGSGKTLSIVLSLLLDDPRDYFVSITISPLKRLQISQESDFNNKYRIPTVAINEDTPHDEAYWNVSTLSRIQRPCRFDYF